jgi:PPOX class probable F420-dependent enzyme
MERADQFRQLIAGDNGLCVVSTARSDGSVQSSVVNAGVLAHPTTGEEVVGLVAMANSAKVKHLRGNTKTTVVVRAGWQWLAAEGEADLVGPDDPFDGVDAERLRVLLREIFTAAGGTHDDWDAYDRAMADERRVCVLVKPSRVYGVAG